MRSATMSAHELMELDRAVNLGLGIAIVVVGVVWILQCGKELWQLMRAR
jgi:hypothetical protein